MVHQRITNYYYFICKVIVVKKNVYKYPTHTSVSLYLMQHSVHVHGVVVYFMVTKALYSHMHTSASIYMDLTGCNGSKSRHDHVNYTQVHGGNNGSSLAAYV